MTRQTPKQPKRQAHARQRGAAERRAMREAETTLARGMAAIFVTAATRVLRDEHGWEPDALTTFGDRLLAEATQMARELTAAPTDDATAAPPDAPTD